MTEIFKGFNINFSINLSTEVIKQIIFVAGGILLVFFLLSLGKWELNGYCFG